MKKYYDYGITMQLATFRGEILFLLAIFQIFHVIGLPLLRKDSTLVNPFVGFYVFPHGGVTLDPVNMDYSREPAFNKPDSKQKAINLHLAMKAAADSLIKSDPDLIIFSTPHGFFLADNPVIVSSAKTFGDAGSIWEQFTAGFDINQRLSTIIYGELKGAKDPIEILSLGSGQETLPILWAEVIPWYFIREAAEKAGKRIPEAIYIGQPSRLNTTDLTHVGRDIVKTVLLRREFANNRIAVVISGDLSHFHSTHPSSPYQYDPISSVFDRLIINWAKHDRHPSSESESNDLLINQAGKLQDKAGHCGYSGLVTLNGMLQEVVNQNWKYKAKLYGVRQVTELRIKSVFKSIPDIIFKLVNS